MYYRVHSTTTHITVRPLMCIHGMCQSGIHDMAVQLLTSQIGSLGELLLTVWFPTPVVVGATHCANGFVVVLSDAAGTPASRSKRE